MMSSYQIASPFNQGILEIHFKNKVLVNGKQEIESIIIYLCEGGIEKSVPRDHRLSSLGKHGWLIEATMLIDNRSLHFDI